MAFDSHNSRSRRSSSPTAFFPSSILSSRIRDNELEDDSIKPDHAAPLTTTPTNEPPGTSLFGVGSPLSLSTSTAPVPLGNASISGAASSMGSPYVPPMNQISMPYIKRHAVKRVKSAKDSCNTELQKVIHSITNYFEERLGEREREEAEEQYAKAQWQQQYMREQQIHAHSHNREPSTGDSTPASQAPVGSPSHHLPAADLHAAIQQLHHASRREDWNDGMTDADDRPLSRTNSRRTGESSSRPHSRQPSFSTSPALRRGGSLHSKVPHSAPVTVPGVHQSGSGEQSPGIRGSTTIYQPAAINWGNQSASFIQPPVSAPLPPPSSQQQPQAQQQPQQQQQSNASKRLSRHMYMPPQHSPSQPLGPQSDISSRSTSRSRSPMPFSQTPTEPATTNSSSPKASNRRLSRHLDNHSVEPPVDPFVSTLHDLIGVCTDIIEMSSTNLTSRPGMGAELVRKVQDVGKAWDNHPDWYGRTWYITVLLAVATLARVVEWFEAERQFWNFEDDDEDKEAEPLTFVLKPEFDGEFPEIGGGTGRDESIPKTPIAATGSSFSFGDEQRSHLSRESSIGMEMRITRNERTPQKDLSGAAEEQDAGRKSPSPMSVSPQPFGPQPAPPGYEDPNAANSEAVRMEASEHLRQKADKAKSSNILMELNLDGEHFLYINRTWMDVIGSDPDILVNTGMGISQLLHPEDRDKFKEASDKLQKDDSHTVEIQFRIQIEEEDDPERPIGPVPEPVYRSMEGSGMLMLDRVEHVSSHTMWVIKPAPESLPQAESEELIVEGPSLPGQTPTTPFRFPGSRLSIDSAAMPVIKTLSATPILCRICENQIPSWFFEKHNETCNEVHKFEADIIECNESIAELRNTVRELISGFEKLGVNIEKSIPDRPVLEYRGMSISSPSSTAATNSPIQSIRGPLASRMQRVGVRKLQQKLLEQVEDILTTAGRISVPSLKEEEANEPIERQRLLSPTSEDHLGKCTVWVKPTPEDPALSRLVQDVDYLIKQKLDTVMRMQNTVRYSEKIRQEWTVKYEEALASMIGEPSTIELSEEAQEEAAPDGGSDDTSSTTSEYDFGRDKTSTEPTPMASSPAPTPLSGLPLVPAMPVPVPATWQGVGTHRHSRSSTPSSVTSPLAIAVPINATTPEAIDRAALLAAVEDSAQTIRARRMSMHNGNGNGNSIPPLLEPKLLVTPPISPLIATTMGPISTTGHARRLSIVQPILSPTVAVAPSHGRAASVAPSAAKAAPSSIKDFDIIKPISKGAFGSVFLAKKKTTGDYFAIKVLKKADMIAKNQITNVKAERMILMKQAESPFVVKLYFTFQSKDNLYLVMEYLNGGDCAALIKTLGSLPEEWTRAYVAEVVLGLEFLHERGIVHRDLKPDNLLIDQHGHLKLTDFGLSRIGLLGRQTRESRRLPERLLGGGKANRNRRSPGSRPTSFDSGYLQSPLLSAKIEDTGSYFNPRMAVAQQLHDDVSESSGSEGVAHLMGRRGKLAHAESPLQSFASELTTELRSQQGQSGSNPAPHSGNTPPGPPEPKFVGTPDYLAPETILGLSEDDRCVDWWALGVITYEFLYGIPPFHAETPDKVFENILSMRIDWHEEWIEFSKEARNFMERLLIYDPSKRLGINGAKEVKAHPFFAEIEWDKVMQSEPQFVPQVTDPESTDYFDPRGAIPQLFQDDETVAINRPPSENSAVNESPSKAQGTSAARGLLRDAVAAPAPDDFGTFNFKNLPVLKQANDEVIKKLKSEQLTAVTHALGDAAAAHHRRRSISRRVNKPTAVLTNFEPKGNTNPPSPSTSVSSIASSPSRGSMGPSTPGSIQAHLRRPSEYSAVDRFKLNQMDEVRRNSMPSRLRTASVSSSDQDPSYSTAESWSQSVGTSTTSASPAPQEQKKAQDTDRAVVCLIAEDNPISAKILETLLVRLGCRCVMATDGAEAISTAHGDIKFDIILMDYHMPVVDGESAARYIKSTNNLNKSTPIVAVSAYVGQDSSVASNLFAACIQKPVHKADLLNVLRQLGFRTSTSEGPKPATHVAKVAAAVS